MVTITPPIIPPKRKAGRPRGRKNNKLGGTKAFALDGTLIKKCYCRRCMETKSPGNFYETCDPYLDKNGKLSVCADCVNDMFDKIYSIEKDYPKTFYKMCRILNIKYNPVAVESAIGNLEKIVEKKGSTIGIFGIYKQKLTFHHQANGIGDLTFSHTPTAISDTPMDDNEVIGGRDLKRFWGEDMVIEDYIFLEEELNDWKKTHKSDTKAEITLLKEICFKQLDIRKIRQNSESVDAALKSLQELMKTASVDPAKTSIAGSGKSNDTFSSFVKTIEENEPAEIYKDKDLFKDHDNIDFYFKKYVTRPLCNFVKGTRDFDVTQGDISEFENDDDIIPLDYIEVDNG